MMRAFAAAPATPTITTAHWKYKAASRDDDHGDVTFDDDDVSSLPVAGYCVIAAGLYVVMPTDRCSTSELSLVVFFESFTHNH